MVTKAAPAVDEALIFVPPPGPTLVIDDEVFTIGKLGVRSSIRLTRLIGSIVSQGLQGREAAKDESEEGRRQAAIQFMMSGLFSDFIMTELLSIVLSSSEREVTRDWVESHWDLEWIFEALDLWLSVNPLDKYLGKMKALFDRVSPMLPTSIQNGSATPSTN